MSKDLVIRCDTCKEQFVFKPNDLKEIDVKIQGEDLIMNYFTCPHCGCGYKVAIKDKNFKHMVDEVTKVRNQVSKSKNKVANDILVKQANDLTARMKQYLRDLNNKFDGTFTFTYDETLFKKELIIQYLPKE